MTDITKKYRKRKNIFFILSLICWMGLCGFLVTYGLCTTINAPSEVTEVTESTLGKELVDLFMPLIVTYGIALVLVVFIREKARNTVWLVNVVLSASIFGTTFMYISIIVFAVDEFIFRPLYRFYKNKYIINTEIDKR